MDGPDLSELLIRHRDDLERFLLREAAGLLRHEGVDDLVQGVHLRALGVEEHFTWQGDAAFLGWIRKVARQHVADRNAYWRALKRSAGHLLRVSTGSDGSRTSGIDPAASMTGPVTFADRRESLSTAMRALDTLRPRDREIIQLVSRDVSLAEIAETLDLSYDAAQQARARALERFRKAFTVLAPRRRT